MAPELALIYQAKRLFPPLFQGLKMCSKYLTEFLLVDSDAKHNGKPAYQARKLDQELKKS